MAGDTDKGNDGKAAEKPSIGFTLPFADNAPVNPIEMMTAATAAGMALSAQFANVFFGMMQAAMEATGKPAATSPTAERTKPEAPVVKPSPVEEPPPVAAAPVAKAPIEASVMPAAAAKVAAKVVKPAVPKKAVLEKKAAAAAKPAAVRAKPAPKQVKAAEVETKAAATAPTPKPKQRRSAKAADDLKAISGIGPKLEGLLNGLNVKRYRDIAAWTDKDVEHFDRELGLDGRIAKDNWIAQAKALLR